MWVHEYDWLGDMDGQRPHHTATDHYGSNQVLFELVQSTAMARSTHVPGSEYRRGGVQRLCVTKGSLDPQRWL